MCVGARARIRAGRLVKQLIRCDRVMEHGVEDK